MNEHGEINEHGETDGIEPEECDSCRYRTHLDPYPCHPDNRLHKRLCNLCASTLTGNGATFFGHASKSGHDFEVMRTICYVGNSILDEIKRVEKRVRDIEEKIDRSMRFDI